jgi:hypothetical protein
LVAKKEEDISSAFIEITILNLENIRNMKWAWWTYLVHFSNFSQISFLTSILFNDTPTNCRTNL